MGTKKQRTDYSAQLVVGGHQYKSVADFARDYGLTYVSVIHHLQKGRTGEDVLQRLGQVPIQGRYSGPPKATEGKRTRKPVSYKGVDYPSMSAACNALGITAHEVYTRTKKGISPEEAIRLAVEQRAEDGTAPSQDEPITVLGVSYSSKAEACRAYNIPWQTVVARMKRSNLNFEQAVIRGNRSRDYTAAATLWGNDTLELYGQFGPEGGTSLTKILNEINGLNEKKNAIAAERIQAIIDTLLRGAYPAVGLYLDKERKVIALGIEDYLHPLGPGRQIYLLLSNPIEPYHLDLELVIPALIDMQDRRDNELEFLRRINALNEKHPGVCVCLMGQTVAVKGMYTAATTGSVSIRLLLRSIRRFIGTAAAIYDALTLD